MARKVLLINAPDLSEMISKEIKQIESLGPRFIFNDTDGEVVETHLFEHCCGVKEIGNFWIHPQWTKKLVLLLLARDVNCAMDSDRVNSVICTTTAGTNIKIRKALPLLGFKVLLKTRNPKTNNLITLWGFTR